MHCNSKPAAFEAHYTACPRFDESPDYNAPEYSRNCKLRAGLLHQLHQVLAPDQDLLLQQLLEAMDEVTELEVRYYFRQGLLAASE